MAATTTVTPTVTPTTVALTDDPFTLGVSSGDPDPTSAVLWTRLRPAGAAVDGPIDVRWEVADDETFTTIAATGTVTAESADGHSVHALVELNGPSWYRFTAGGWTSPIGRVAPVPAGSPDRLRMAAASCQHWETGYYAAHRDIVEWGPDVVLFLGDFIYEGPGNPVRPPDRVRTHGPAEATDLASYRARYELYLSDPDLQASRARCPWLVIWDDHEVANNYASLAPQDPADRPGFAARRAAAYRVWWEHMPVRLAPPVDGTDYTISRRITWGGLVDLLLLDGRQFRSDQACGDIPLDPSPACQEASAPDRTMLGATQEQWVADELAATQATWAVLGQQTVMTDLRLGDAILNYDQWDGYAPARDRLLAAAAATDRLVVLTGDIHLAGVGVLPGVGVEFVTTSISSAGNVDVSLQPTIAGFDTVVDAELAHRGYTRHVVTPDRWTAEYRIVDDAADPASTISTWRTFGVDATQRDAVTTAD
ncbi:MAG: alkaline phosphatase D family protein [Acidimicrobiia bacterium]|nr:alkaline phosphatase D family protein [Acidimicrobiia bacterium]